MRWAWAGLSVTMGFLRPQAADVPAATPVPASATPQTAVASLDGPVRAVAESRHWAAKDVGIAIVDVQSGRVLAAHNEHQLLNPASNAKLFTAAAALSILHGSYRYQTTLSGTVKNGSLVGSLVLRGQGDPSLSSRDLWQLAVDLRAHGVRRIDGDILVDQRRFDEQFTPPAFEQQPHEWAAFRAPVSPVAVNENTIMLTVRPGSGDVAAVSFEPPGFVDVEGTVKVTDGGGDNVILELTPNGRRLKAKVGGSVARDARLVRYTRRVDDPALLAGYVLKNHLDQLGIKVSGDVKTGSLANARVLVSHESAPLSVLLHEVGKMSDNFYAEMVFKSLGGEAKGRPASSAAGAKAVFEWADKAGVLDPGSVIVNGSGLFDANRVTASSFAQLLRKAYLDPAISSEFVAQLAIGGVDGTLHRRFREQRKDMIVRAKTGTLEDTVALSGYVLAPSGKGPVAFSILFNHVAGHVSDARQAADRLVRHIVDALHDRR